MISEDNSLLSINEFLDESGSKNTKKLQNQIVSLFNQTMDALNIKENINSHKKLDDCSIDELPDAISRFFMVCVKADGTKYNASSLNTYYKSLARYLKLRDVNPVDIITDLRYKKVAEVVKARTLESAKSGQRPGMHASQSLSPAELKQMMESGAMSRNDPRALISLIHYILVTGFGSRAREVINFIAILLKSVKIMFSSLINTIAQ